MTRQELDDQINRQWEQIQWTARMINDSQEHPQIVRLEARLKYEYRRLAELEAMETTI